MLAAAGRPLPVPQLPVHAPRLPPRQGMSYLVGGLIGNIFFGSLTTLLESESENQAVVNHHTSYYFITSFLLLTSYILPVTAPH